MQKKVIKLLQHCLMSHSVTNDQCDALDCENADLRIHTCDSWIHSSTWPLWHTVTLTNPRIHSSTWHVWHTVTHESTNPHVWHTHPRIYTSCVTHCDTLIHLTHESMNPHARLANQLIHVWHTMTHYFTHPLIHMTHTKVLRGHPNPRIRMCDTLIHESTCHVWRTVTH